MTASQPKLILASQSPHRKALLSGLGLSFEVKPADVDESTRKSEKPFDYCKRVTRAKAQKIADENPNCGVLAADTPVVCGRHIMQKAETAEEAADMLRLQSGRRVHVPTAVVVISAQGKIYEKLVDSWVKFKPMTQVDIDRHVADEQNWRHISGALKIQEPSSDRMIKCIHGSLSGIIGLPLYETSNLLKRAGVQV